MADDEVAEDHEPLCPRPWTAALIVGETRLPATLRQAVKIELGVAFHSPYEIPIAVAFNGALMTVLWFFLPAH